MIQGVDSKDLNNFQEQIKLRDWYQVYSTNANYTFTDVDKIKTLLVTTSSSTITVTLPTVADNTGRRIEIIKVDSGTGKITLDGEGAETINGNATIDFKYQYEGCEIVSNGSAWYILRWIPCAGSGDYKEDYSIAHGTSVDRANQTIANWSPSVKGLYKITAQCSFYNGQNSGGSTNYVYLRIYKNATATRVGLQELAHLLASNEYISLHISDVLELLSTDTIYLYAYANNASVVSVFNPNGATSGWRIERLYNMQSL